MSKRFSHLWRITAAPCAVLALLLLLSQPAQATNTAVRISKVQDALPGDYAYVSVSLENQGSQRSFGGFDFLVAYDASGLSLMEVTPGSLLDSCGWEYFSYRSGPFGNCGGTCPSGMLRIVALAETNNGDTHPWCFFDGRSGELAWMKFRVADDVTYECTDIPISFYWIECGDNVMSSVLGDSLHMSSKVFEFSNQFDITGQPGYGGWQGILDSSDCLFATINADAVLDFYNGEIQITCSDTIDQRGDINLNGIDNEIIDLVMFTNYFLSGLSAFESGGDVSASVAATDVNADGIPLTYRDAVYLYRIVMGEALPFPTPAAGASVDAYFHQDPGNHMVAVNCSLPLAGAFMLIKGNVTPTYLIPQVGWGQYAIYDGTYTRILILGDPGQPYGNGVWFTYQGTGKLESVETTDWHDTYIAAHISQIATDCGNFNGSGGIDISDVVYVIRYIFSGGVAPVDIHGGDVNCDNSCNIADVVYELAYIFSGGPAPCANCK
ncbi:MAG: hypothetical protein E4G91_09680 [Candidatus Zixiibacteriota bacterium]|nr:MAG: hypothetical protein E4G91_09680 [candidate division Zixibacteria bacterium]